MQVNIYVKDSDYDTLAKHNPVDSKTTSAFMTDILRKKAEFLRSTETQDGTPVVQQYERP